MLENLRRYEVQARYAFALALASILPGLLAMGLGWRNFDWAMGRIIYGGRGRFLPAFLGCVLISLAPAVLAFALGLNSAGQRRNDRSGRSWFAFFVGGSILTFDLILLIAFYLLRLERAV